VPTTFTETPVGKFLSYSDYQVQSVEQEGPEVEGPVQVSCVVAGHRTGGPLIWWYRIASSPFENKYYAPAGSFFNGGADTTGEHNPPVDPAVPPC
jgi:hypothetical protein